MAILGFHCIWTTYGTWLPNEPRGSWSKYIANRRLHAFGPATTVDTRRSPAHETFDHARKKAMQATLTHAPVTLEASPRRIAGEAMGEASFTFHALAVMPDHVHVVMRRMGRPIRKVIGHLKSNATRALRREGHFVDRQIWTEYGWSVYLSDIEAVEHAIEYVERNPVREGMKRQSWMFVEPFI